MTAQFIRNDAVVMLGHQDRNWVAVGSTQNENNHDLRTSPTKLLFNEDFPASAKNRATRVGPPVPILIEKLLPQSEVHKSVDSSKSSISFTALSEERLQAAVKLAKRDLRRRHLEGLKKLSAKSLQESSLSETSDVELRQELEATSSKTEAKISSPKERRAQTGVKQQTSSIPHVGQTPPNKHPGLKQVARDKQAPLSNEINKLQNELERYIQKVEELAKRGEKMEEPLEPEELNKLEIRRQKQAAHSARVIYVLQQQVKEIQEDVEKLRREKTWNSKRSIAINRLAAAHRGTLRALQVIIHQLSDLSYNKVPPYYKELGQLIRQLSLCSAKVEVNQGSAVPERALDILQKVEILDSALSKQEMLEKVQAQSRPPRSTSPQRSTSPSRPTNPRRGVRAGRRRTLQKPKSASHQPTKRREVLRFGLQSIIQQRALKEQPGRSQKNTNCRKQQHAERRKADVIRPNQKRDAGFHLPTVSSRLRVNQQPEKDQSVPWMPTSPHSPPHQRKPVQKGSPEPRCLFPPVKISSSPTKQQQEETEFLLSSAKKKDSPNKALRKAHPDEVTRQKLKELNRLSKEEPQRSRSEVVWLNQWADGAEQKAREINQTLIHEKQQDGETRKRVDSLQRIRFSEQKSDMAPDAAGQQSEVLLEDLLEDDAWAAETDRQVESTSRCGRQAPTLESMLLRMEEIQRDEEDVRRRFASITYSDPLFWERPAAAGSQRHAPGSRPASPQPIRLTRPVLKQTSAADIVLEKPVDTGFLLENAPMEEASQEEQPPTNKTMSLGAADRSRTVIPVSGSTLRNIRRYQDNYDTYLRNVAREVASSFNPWAVAESLADELLSEALAEVAEEFQEVVEEYAEAVFTSEFLRPIQSPPSTSAALVGQ